MPFQLSRDGWLLFAASGVRSFAYGFLSVVLGLYLAAVGMSPTAIGWIFTAALAGGAVMTIVIIAVADRFGRKALLIVGALLMALAGCVFVMSDNPIWLGAAAIFGTISPSGKEVGPFLSLERAILPQTTGDRASNLGLFRLQSGWVIRRRALGALAVSPPSVSLLTELAGYRLLIWA